MNIFGIYEYNQNFNIWFVVSVILCSFINFIYSHYKQDINELKQWIIIYEKVSPKCVLVGRSSARKINPPINLFYGLISFNHDIMWYFFNFYEFDHHRFIFKYIFILNILLLIYLILSCQNDLPPSFARLLWKSQIKYTEH